jgi:hypothetical protein
MFWSGDEQRPVAGRLVAHTAQISAPGSTTSNSNDNKLVVEWNKAMRCDGLVLQFIGAPDINGNRVKAFYQTQSMLCNEMQITLNRRVMFFDDQSPIEPEAVQILCVHDVILRNRQLDAQGIQKSVDYAKVTKLQYDVKNDYFKAAGPGELNSVFRGSGQGFDNLAGTPSSSVGTPRNNEALNYLAVWFQDEMQGTLLGNNKKVDIRGRRVTAAYCPANSWDDVIGIENLAAARQKGYTLECSQLLIEEMPNPVNLAQSSMELTAAGTAVIDGSGIFGKAQTITYNQAKSIVDMNGKVKLTTSQGLVEAESIRYNVETRNVELIQMQSLGIH